MTSSHQGVPAPTRPDREWPRRPTRCLVRHLVDDDWAQVEALVPDARRALAGDLQLVAVEPDDPGRVLGVGIARRCEGPREHLGTIVVVVAPADRGRGAGRRLGDHLVAWHRDQGATGVVVDAIAASDRASRHLAAGLGLAECGRVPGGVRLADGRLDDLLQLHLDLRVHDRSQRPRATAADRDRVLEAAGRSFVERGWTATSTDDLAEELGMRPEDVRRVGGTKAEMLWAASVRTIVPEHTTLSQLIDGVGLPGLATVDERLDGFVDLACRVSEGLAPYIPAREQAAALDPAAQAMRQGSDLRRLAMSRKLVGLLCREGEPRPDAAELVQVLMMTETYVTFLRNGLSRAQYAAWLREALDRAVNGERADRRTGPGSR